MKSLNERIKQLRKDKGLTQTQLADLLGVTDKAVSKWEVGEANPDISLLVKIAEIFGVSIDYLLTGVAKEKEVVIISPKEMLFKTDDPKYLEQISENDLNVVDMYQHKLVNVFTYLMDNNKIRSYIRGKRGRLGNTDDYIPELLYLSLVSNKLEQLKVFNFNDIGFADEKEWTKEMTDEFVSGERVNEKTREYVLSIHKRELISVNQGYAKNTDTYHKYGNWQILYPIILSGAVDAKNWELTKRILDIFLSINEPAAKQFDEVKGVRYGDGNNYFLSFKPQYYSQVDKYIVVLEIPHGVLDTLLKEQQFDLLDVANKINGCVGKYTVSKKSIDLVKLEADDSISDEEKFEQKCVYKRIINVNLLSGSDDLKLVRKILDNNYYHYFEMVYDLLMKGNNKELFEFFIDNDYEELAKLLFDSSDDGKGKLLSRAFNCFIVQPPVGLYKEHQELLKNQNSIDLEETDWEIRRRERGEKTFRTEFIKQYGNLEKLAATLKDNPIILHIKELKERVYNGIIDRQEAVKAREREAKEREKMAKGLTKSYFEKLLSSGTAESIKLFKLELCSLLDAILIYDYHYEGEDFSERMNAHFKKLESDIPEERQKDDGWGYMVPDTEFTENVIEPERKRVSHLRDIFYRLRVSRNNILHPEKVKIDELTEKELRECLEYVFSINTKVEE